MGERVAEQFKNATIYLGVLALRDEAYLFAICKSVSADCAMVRNSPETLRIKSTISAERRACTAISLATPPKPAARSPAYTA
jgi:hypothetical protein